MRRIGIMGGTFNPVHIGHLILAEWALDTLKLEEVWFIPTGISYKKDYREMPSGETRLYMTELAVRDNTAFKCIDIEVRRKGYTYSYETLEQLKIEYPQVEFFFITGADCLFSIENWKRPDKIFDCCTLAAAVRGDAGLQEMERKKLELEQKFAPQSCGKIILLPFISMAVSSTEIRSRIRRGLSVRYLVPDQVLAYINEKGLYCEGKSEPF